MATISTGGFAPYKESIGYFGGGSAPAVQAAVLVFMILGATSFPLYYQARIRGFGHFFRDPQLQGLLVVIAIGFLLLAGARRWQDHGIHWLFTAASATTTTGFSLGAPAKWPAETHFIAVLLMLIGGTAGSTAGGLKIFRVLIMGKLALNLLLRATATSGGDSGD